MTTKAGRELDAAYATGKDFTLTPAMYREQKRRWPLIVAKGQAEALARGDFYGYILWARKGDRPFDLQRIADRLTDRQYWQLVGDVWTGIEAPYYARQDWVELLRSKRPGREAMMETCDDHDREIVDEISDLKIFRDLPERLVLYRGVLKPRPHFQRKYAWSWSLSRTVAEFFATRWNQPGGKVYQVECDRGLAIAYFNGFNGREEQEILIGEPSRLTSVIDLGLAPITG
jgi:hypothetical protein